MKEKMYKIFYLLFILNCISLYAQEDKEKKKALIESDNLVYDANEELTADNFVEAEANYRKAISKNAENATAKYNLGNVYYGKSSYGEAFSRFKQAGETAATKEQKHKAYHNMGNVFMKSKEYDKAVEAYKEALRNNPTDEETRYNLALAKEMLKKQEEEQQKNDQNKDEKENEKEKKEDQENKDKGEDKKDDKGDPKDKNEDENKDKGEGENEDENKEDKGDKKEDQQKQEGEGDKKEEQNAQQQPRPNQMSPQQVKNMLKAIEDEEKKVQEKVNAQKVKGRPVSTEKDW